MEESKREDEVVTSWAEFVDCLCDAKAAWGVFQEATAGLSGRDVEMLPMSVQKHICHPWRMSTFDNLMAVIVSYWSQHGGPQGLRPDEGDIPGGLAVVDKAINDLDIDELLEEEENG